MKTILVLTPRFPYPAIGGDRLRIYQICKSLSENFSLTLLSLCETEAEMAYQIPNDGVFDEVHRVRLPKWRSWINCMFHLVSKTPLQVAYYKSGKFATMARELGKKNDAYFAHLIRTADMVKDMPGVKFLEMTDAISLNYDRVRSSRSNSGWDYRKLVYKIESNRLSDYERRIVTRFDHSFLVSAVDRDFLFSNLECHPVSVATNGVDTTSLPYGFISESSDIAFIGNMLSMQNLDAAQFIAEDILPHIRRRIPQARLRLIGRISEKHQARLSSFDGVIVTGEVSNVSDAAKGCAVGVCPVRLGAGVQNKVLEYMALGLPTVSTSVGLEGFAAQPDRELLVADEAEAFADQVVRLIHDRELAEGIAIAGRRYVEDRHSWQAVLQPINHVIRQSLVDADPSHVS